MVAMMTKMLIFECHDKLAVFCDEVGEGGMLGWEASVIRSGIITWRGTLLRLVAMIISHQAPAFISFSNATPDVNEIWFLGGLPCFHMIFTWFDENKCLL